MMWKKRKEWQTSADRAGGKKRRWGRYVFATVAGLALAVIAAGALLYFGSLRSLKGQAVTSDAWETYDSELGERVLPDTVSWNGREYRRNEKIYTILCMGIDTENDMVAEGTGMRSGAQSDANFLVVVDAKQDKLSVLAIPRDTMTEIACFDTEGTSTGVIKDHLALQYAYGDGGSRSCELMQQSVSRLFCHQPVDAYVTFSLNAIEALNGMVGGVSVVLMEDLDGHREGEEITLNNEQAYQYIRVRDCAEDYSAEYRLQRQKQYLTAFIEKVIAYTKEDIRTPFRMYEQVSDSVLTNLSDAQILSLVLLGLQCDFSEESLYIVPGEQVLGGYYEEYHVDEQGLYELILEIFYLEEDGLSGRKN